MTYNETSCFQTGLWAESLPNRLLGTARPALFETEFDGELPFDPLPRFGVSGPALVPIAVRALSAFEELLRDRLVAIPLTSLSVSSVGSLLTNSFCSN